MEDNIIYNKYLEEIGYECEKNPSLPKWSALKRVFN